VRFRGFFRCFVSLAFLCLFFSFLVVFSGLFCSAWSISRNLNRRFTYSLGFEIAWKIAWLYHWLCHVQWLRHMSVANSGAVAERCRIVHVALFLFYSKLYILLVI
jgi:hypothetical protein